MSKYASVMALVAFLVMFLLQRRWLAVYRRRVGDAHAIDDTVVSASLLAPLRRLALVAVPSPLCAEALLTVAFVAMFALQSLLRVQRAVADGRVVEALLALARSGGIGDGGCRGRRVAGAGPPAAAAGGPTGGSPHTCALAWTRRWQLRLAAGPDRSARRALVVFAGYALGSAATAGAIEHLRMLLISRYRTRLTVYFHSRFLAKLRYYHATVLDDRIRDADTHITVYCHEFAEHFAELPYYFLLPMFDAAAALAVVARAVGGRPAAAMSAVVLATLVAVRRLSPAFGRMHAAELAREEDFRRLHADVRSNVEQIAMEGGGGYTRRRLDACYDRVREAMEQLALARGHFQALEGAASAVWDVVALLVCRRVIAREAGPGSVVSAAASEKLLGAVLVQRRVVSTFHDSVKAFVVNWRELSHLAEFTQKLAAFDAVLDDVAAGRLERRGALASASGGGGGEAPGSGSFGAAPANAVWATTKAEATALYVAARDPHLAGAATPLAATPPSLLRPQAAAATTTAASPQASPQVFPGVSSPLAPMPPPMPLPPVLVSLHHATVATPSGVTLIRDLSLDVRQGDTWAIQGNNGSGKSSVLRVLAGLWLLPAKGGGTLRLHPLAQLVCLPQCAYLLSGATLVDQLFFPETPLFDPMSIEAIRGAARAFATEKRASSGSNNNNDSFAAAVAAATTASAAHSGGDAFVVHRVRPTLLAALRRAVELATAGSVIDDVLGGWESGVVGLTESTRDTTYDWHALSGGQQQKIAMARLFFRCWYAQSQGRVPVACLDESSSQLDRESERAVYANLRESGVTVVSVSHRQAVTRLHRHVLQLASKAETWSVVKQEPRYD